MHELLIARGLLEAVKKSLNEENRRVLRVDLDVGSASGIVLDSLRLAFAIVSK